MLSKRFKMFGALIAGLWVGWSSVQVAARAAHALCNGMRESAVCAEPSGERGAAVLGYSHRHRSSQRTLPPDVPVVGVLLPFRHPSHPFMPAQG